MNPISKSMRVLRSEGARGLAQRAARMIYCKLDAAELDFPLLDRDIADSTVLDLPVPGAHQPRGEPLKIGWITVPPGAGSGGHTTLFRMVEAVEKAGHSCELFFYDRYGNDVAEQERVLRQWWPGLRARVRNALEGISGVDAAVASSWQTAHVLARRGVSPMRRIYFIQDFEPYFYPRGSLYSLAEDTYRFGFRNIALGEMVAQLIRSEVGVIPDVTQFGCDTSVYRPLPGAEHTGVVCYARPGVPRRGFELARLALAEFHRARPDVPIHLYGSVAEPLPFHAVQHGRLSPLKLNELYNRCFAGLAMSFTNISLVAEEMLAAGTIPVVNDSPYSRADLVNDHVAWAAPTPHSLARALERAFDCSEREQESAAAAASVRPWGWSKAQADVVQIIEDEVCGPAQFSPRVDMEERT